MPALAANMFSITVGDAHARLGPMTYNISTTTDLWPYGDAARAPSGAIEVRRRFNEFAELYAELQKRAAAHEEASPRGGNPLAGVAALPPLPSKKLFASQAAVRARGRGAGRYTGRGGAQRGC